MVSNEFEFGLAREDFKYTRRWGYYYESKLAQKKMLRVFCGRNDSVAFQVLLLSRLPMIVSLSKQYQCDPHGLIDVVRVKICLDHPEIKIQTNLIGLVEDDNRLQQSEILLEQKAIFVEERIIQPIWVELKTGINTQPGSYTGTVIIYGHGHFEDEQELGRLRFVLEVHDVALPSPQQGSFHLDIWQHCSNIARKYDVALWTDEHFQLLESYVAALADIGQKVVTAIVSEIPWAGQFSMLDHSGKTNLYEYSMISLYRSMSGEMQYDFSALDRYVELCFKHGIDCEIEVFGLVGIWQLAEAGFGSVIEDLEEPVRLRYYDEKDGCLKFVRRKEDFLDYVRALETHFIEKNWIERVRISSDEPKDKEHYIHQVECIHRVAPRFRFKALLNEAGEFLLNLPLNITDVSCILMSFVRNPSAVEHWRAKVPGCLQWSVCCAPERPNTYIRSPLLESRLVGWLTWYLKLDGFLRWGFTAWPEKPLEQVSFRSPHWPAGDTHFVYPGRSGKPLLSLRYKMLQRGIRDYELLKMAANHPDGQFVVDKAIAHVIKVDDPSKLHPDVFCKTEDLYSIVGTEYDEAIYSVLAFLSGAHL